MSTNNLEFHIKQCNVSIQSQGSLVFWWNVLTLHEMTLANIKGNPFWKSQQCASVLACLRTHCQKLIINHHIDKSQKAFVSYPYPKFVFQKGNEAAFTPLNCAPLVEARDMLLYQLSNWLSSSRAGQGQWLQCIPVPVGPPGFSKPC